MTNRLRETEHTPLDLMPGAFEVFDARVSEVAPDAWDNATPCTEWNVRDLLNHMVSEHLWAPPLLDGEAIESVGDAFDGDVVGRLFDGNARAAWAAAAGQSRTRLAAVADPAGRVNLSRGPTPTSQYATEMLLDLVVHGWDLARGAGLDERGDAAAAAYLLDALEANKDAWLGASVFAPPVETNSTDPLERLVALLGRQP